MKVLRNHEFLGFLIGSSILTTLFSIVLLHFIPSTILLLLIQGIFLLGCFILFQQYRYRRIAQLCEYLQQVYNGMDCLDIRDHQEGELSILKSDLYKITKVLMQQKELLAKDKLFLADSLSNISHQLKTPLTSVLMLNELLAQEDVPKDKREEFRQQMQQQLQRIEWLIRTLLKISKIDADAIVFEREELSMKQLIEESAEALLIPMELKNLSFCIQCKDDIMVQADRNWTKEALGNIIKNCMEHTPIDGTITVSCEENPLHVQLQIQDNGNGIDAQDLPHIFERFYKGKNAGIDSVGIGLSLSQMICNRQNATIEVQSETDKGTCFTIRFYKG